MPGYTEAQLETMAKGRAASEAHGEDYLWLGDLSGWTVHNGEDYHTTVMHRCGHTVDVARSHRYLGNIVADIVRPHLAEGCDY